MKRLLEFLKDRLGWVESGVRQRVYVLHRLNALQGYLGLVLIAIGVAFSLGFGFGLAVLGAGLYIDAWRSTSRPRNRKDGNR